jgi:hypothetical protein
MAPPCPGSPGRRGSRRRPRMRDRRCPVARTGRTRPGPHHPGQRAGRGLRLGGHGGVSGRHGGVPASPGPRLHHGGGGNPRVVHVFRIPSHRLRRLRGGGRGGRDAPGVASLPGGRGRPGAGGRSRLLAWRPGDPHRATPPDGRARPASQGLGPARLVQVQLGRAPRLAHGSGHQLARVPEAPGLRSAWPTS